MSCRNSIAVRSLIPALLTFALLGVQLVACGRTASDDEADRQQIQAMMEIYLPKLAEAYATLEPQVLSGMAAPKEVLSVEKRIDDLLTEGRTLRPTFHEVTIESLDVWNYANAYVTTVEVWDLDLYATGAEEPYRSLSGQRDRVKYQLKREGDSWLILYRAVQGSTE